MRHRAPPQKSETTAADKRQIAVWPLEIASEWCRCYNMCMLCDICDCAAHPNQVCATCVNCIGSHVQWADYDHVHTEFVDGDGVTQAIVYAEEDITQDTVCTRTKPHYRYNGKTGEITLVDAVESSTTGDLTADLIADSFGL